MSEVLSPSTPYELAAALRRLKERGGRLGVDARLDRSRLEEVGAVEAKSGLVTAGAGVELGELEATVQAQGFSLGSLSPRQRSLQVGEFLEGPYAGLRAIPGGLLEPMSIAIAVMLPDGRVWRSHPSPRRAMGPELPALFLGGGGRCGLIIEATLRCAPRAIAARMELHSFPSASEAIEAMLSTIDEGAGLERVRIQKIGERVLLEVELAGSIEGVENDLATYWLNVERHGGRPSRQLPATASSSIEREASWQAVEKAVDAGAPLTLYRLALCSVVAVGDVEGRELASPVGGALESPLEELAGQLDPTSMLGGPR